MEASLLSNSSSPLNLVLIPHHLRTLFYMAHPNCRSPYLASQVLAACASSGVTILPPNVLSAMKYLSRHNGATCPPHGAAILSGIPINPKPPFDQSGNAPTFISDWNASDVLMDALAISTRTTINGLTTYTVNEKFENTFFTLENARHMYAHGSDPWYELLYESSLNMNIILSALSGIINQQQHQSELKYVCPLKTSEKSSMKIFLVEVRSELTNDGHNLYQIMKLTEAVSLVCYSVGAPRKKKNP